jgi:glycosyltransferase involved in cell wall biosynthesis
MKQKPLISILLPVHNSQEFLSECLSSLKKQTYRNIEIIAIDDKSTDGSYKILKNLKSKDKRFRIYRNVKRYGIAMTLNRLIRKARGEFIAFMGAQDIASRERIEKQVKFLLENPEIVALGTQWTFINKNGTKVRRSKLPLNNREIYKTPLHGLSMQFETVMINRSLIPKDILKVSGNITPFIYSDFLLKLLPYGRFANLKNSLYYHRTNPSVYIDDVKRNIFSFIKLWIRGVAEYDYKFSLRFLSSSLLPRT